jgi:hypothetical protein
MPAELTPNQLKWVEALESGDFNQDVDNSALTLVDESEEAGSHCCLGVACELALADGVALTVSHYGGMRRYGVDVSYLPPEVQGWLGTSSNPYIAGRTASSMNDNGEPFKDIAAAIREHGLS